MWGNVECWPKTSLAQSLLGAQKDLSVICICRFTYHEGLALLLSSALASKSLYVSRAVSYCCVTEFDIYHKVVSSNMSRLEAHAGFFRLLMKGIFDAYVLLPFGKSWFPN